MTRWWTTAALTVGLCAFGTAQRGQPNASYLQALAGPAGLPTIHYTLDLTHPADHLAAITIEAPATGAQTIFDMPAWYPGRYSIYNFAVNVQQTRASCAGPSGDPLPVRRLDPNRWAVTNGNCRQVRWQYRVYGAQPLNGSFFQLDDAHANLNGGPVYMYPETAKPDPVALDILAPAGWKVLNELGQLDQTHLWFPNYDIFIDAPTEAAPSFTLDQFQADGKTYRVLIHDFTTPDSNGDNRKALLAGLEKIVHAENGVIAPDELDTYTFFFHFEPQSGDGMEHLFGTQIMVRAGLGAAQGLSGAESTAAHEFFHQWNIKRIRPAALGPWNYEAQNPTPSLWVGEGFTQYYGDITLERTGIVNQDAYLRGLGRSLGNSLYASGYKLMSAEDASLTAWFHDATPLEQETNEVETTISYYTRGEQIAATLDLDIRRRTAGRKSLNDVMRWLWENIYHAPRATYYLPGRGYTDMDVQHAVEAVTGTSYAGFFRDYVAGTKPIPYDSYLAAAGLRLACRVPEGVRSYSGARVAANAVRGVDPDSPAETAGLGNDQEIVSINGQAGADINSLPPNRMATLVVRQHGVESTLQLMPAEPPTSACELAPIPGATETQLQLRGAWLRP